MGIIFGHFPKYFCGHNTCEKRVSVISTSLNLPRSWVEVCIFCRNTRCYYLPTFLLTIYISEKDMLPVVGKLTAKCPLCSTRSPSFSRQPQHFHLNTTPSTYNDVIILAIPAILLLGAEEPEWKSSYSGVRIAPQQTLSRIIPIILIPDWSQTNVS